ncbi:Protein-export protein SecB [Hydrogenovibrio crunogenus]|uniref:Protein-export protein SecB n=1 Tax=Hydrogenovibrio crunogenus TaxID=39765 RepID=A0A4V1C932_9GAMM|nr:protein-export chaperone SecB [Hydrogenovibrio crunogenus]QBZ83994.1 Protein-export protein SecB [Hydrogenovibrio crunogenus]
MSEENQEKQFGIQKVYTRNVSFEAPNSPEIFTQDFQPQLDVDLNVESRSLEEGVFHVVVRVTATTKMDDKTAFLCEVEQAGIFTLMGFDEGETNYLLGVQCPNTLFPYAREAVSDLVTRGGFPQLLLEPVNFEGIYADHLQKQAESTKQ